MLKVKDRPLTIDDVCQLQRQPEYKDERFELINGELITMAPVNWHHATLAVKIGRFLDEYCSETDAGTVGSEGGFYPADDHSTLLAPDVAFVSKDRLAPPFPQTFTGLMPDLAVEIASPSNTRAELRRKATIYLRNGSRLVWLVLPAQKAVEVCRLTAHGQITIEFVGSAGKLSGDDILPGFTLELRALFP